MIKVIGAEQGGPPPEPSGAAGPELVEGAESAAVSYPTHPSHSPAVAPDPAVVPAPADIPFLTVEEKRRILARIARVDPLDCFDDTGAFDIVRAKRVLPPGAVRHLSVHEITRLNAEGQPVTERRIDVRLVDPVSALRLDDLMERRREPTASHSNSSSRSSTKTFSRRDFKLLTEKTMALDDALQSIEHLKKALAEMDDRELQLSKELDEKDRQLEAAQSDTGCQPVQEKLESSTSCHPADPKSQNAPETQTNVEASAPNTTQVWTPKHLEELEALCLWQEVEDAKGSMGEGAFAAWMKAVGLDPKKFSSPGLRPKPTFPGYNKDARYQLAKRPPRPPPKYDPMSFAAQGIVRYVE